MAYEKQGGWGGRRANSGRKPLLEKAEIDHVRALIAQHGSEPHNEKSKQARILDVLDTLYEEGVINKSMFALKEYTDRQVGKVKESVDITTNNEKINMGVVYLPSKTNENTLETDNKADGSVDD